MIIILGVAQVAANCWRYVSAPLHPTSLAKVCVCPRISSFGPRCTALHKRQQTSTNVVVRGSVKRVKPTCEESNLQRKLQERVSSVLFAFLRAGLFMWSAKCVQEKNSAFSVVA